MFQDSSSGDEDEDDSDDFQKRISLISRKTRRKCEKRSVCKQLFKLTEVCLKFESIFSQIVNVEWGFVDVSIQIFLNCREYLSPYIYISIIFPLNKIF